MLILRLQRFIFYPQFVEPLRLDLQELSERNALEDVSVVQEQSKVVFQLDLSFVPVNFEPEFFWEIWEWLAVLDKLLLENLVQLVELSEPPPHQVT